MQKFIAPTKSNNNSNNNNNNNKEIIIRHQHNKVHHYYPEKQKQLPQLPLQQKKNHKNDWHNSKEIPPPKVKLSGYLKKKRNKVGGWRKMWFVLQDQLLLSYSSKDEYDKKLVSFKDVLNLVPGTVVQSLGGSRFTIETTSSQLYTFRCDDTKACTEWITALNESLALKLNSISTKDLNTIGLPDKQHNKSLDNIQYQPRKSKKPIRNSYSCDSIVRTKNQNQNNINCNGNKLPARIPIAESTARILQRNGVSSNDLKKSTNYGQNGRDNYNIKYQNLSDERARNFRLHEKRLSSGAILNQSDEVSRINRMFSRSTTNIRNSLLKTNRQNIDNIITTTNDRSLLAVNNEILNNHKINGKLYINSCKYCNDYNHSSGVCYKNRQYFDKLQKSQYLLDDLRNLDNFYLMATNPMTITKTIDDKINKDQQLNGIKKCCMNNKIDNLYDLNQNKMKNLENCFCTDTNCKCENCEHLPNDNVVTFVDDDVNSSLMIPIEDQIQRLSLKEIPFNIHTKYTTSSNGGTANTNCDGSRTRTAYTETEFPLLELQNLHYSLLPPRLPTGSSKEILSTTKNMHRRNSTTSNNSPITSPTNSSGNNISPVSTDASTSYLLDAFSLKYNSSSGSGGGSSFAIGCGVGGRRLSASSDNINKTSVVEPIYAVVDLKNKYARRARIRELQEQMATVMMGTMVGKDKDRPNSIHCVTSSDYEEVLNFSSECLDGSEDDNEDEDENENIYEPINIPEYSCHHHHHRRSQRNALWKYFPRLNIDALIEMARNRTKNRDRSTKSSHTSLPINDFKETSEQQEDQQQSPFSDFRKKMGNHRKSIKLRMKKFYGGSRSAVDRNCPNNGGGVLVKERNAFSDDELDSQGATGSTSGASENSLKSACGGDKPLTTTTTGAFVFGEFEKYRRGEKQFFGSLSRLKKTRTSLCIEDDSDCKKKTLKKSHGNINNNNSSNNNNNNSSNNNNNSNDFDEELKREVIRRSGRKKDECHSQFFD